MKLLISPVPKMARRMRNMVQSATELVRVATLAGSAEIRSGK